MKSCFSVDRSVAFKGTGRVEQKKNVYKLCIDQILKICADIICKIHLAVELEK